jgi:CO/xanthine dehydrogenase FAD-binding subunit
MRSDPADYDLVIADSLPAALALLSRNEGWRPLAGGTDLMVLFNAGRLPYNMFVSVGQLPELRAIEASENSLIVGAGITYSEIRAHPVLRSEFPLLWDAAGWIGGTANQNRGTLGGNIANASPAADSSPMLLVYDAELELSSKSGVRWVPYSRFHIAYKQTQLRVDELITRIRLARSSFGATQYARKIGTRKAQAISKVCFAATARHTGKTVRDIRIAVGSVAPTPLRCFETERALRDVELSAKVMERAMQTLADEISPIDDIRSTQRYRTQVALDQLAAFLGGLS